MVTYRLATTSDYPKINEFHNRNDKPNRTLQDFNWEFHEGPFGESIYVIAEDKGEIVGTNCVIPIDLIHSSGNVIKSGKSEDTLVDLRYRGQNIFQNIYSFLFEECKKKEITLIWGFTSATKAFEKIGFEVPFYQHQGLAVNAVIPSYNFLKKLNSKNKFSDKCKIFGLTLYSFFKFKLSLNKYNFSFSLQEKKDDNNFSELLIQHNLESSNDCFAIHQNSNYQKWRIYNNPNYFKNHTFLVYNQKQLCVAIIEVNSTKDCISFINQSTFHPYLTDEMRMNIIRTITKLLFKKGSINVRNWLFNTSDLNIKETKIFQNSGYFFLERGMAMVWKNLDETKVNPFDFYLSRIASQGIF